MKKFKMNFKVILLLFLTLNLSHSLYFKVTSQATFDSTIQTISSYANKQFIEEIYIDGYSLVTYNLTNISGISILSQCTGLKKIMFKLGCVNIPQHSKDQFFDAIQNLEHVEHFLMHWYNTGQKSFNNLDKIINKFVNLTYFYVHYQSNQLTDICTAVQNIKNRTKLTYLLINFQSNGVTSVSCFENMFTNLTELTYLGILFHGAAVTSIVPFTHAFHTLKKVSTLVFYGYSNPFTVFCMSHSFSQMTALKSLTFEMGPTFSSSTRWNDFGVVHSTLETIRYVVRPYLSQSTQLFNNLPNLKRAEMMFRNDYDYNSLRHCANSLQNSVHLETFWVYAYGVSNAYGFNISGWTDLFNNIKLKIKRFEFIVHNSGRQIDTENFQNVINESKLPNLEEILFVNDRPSSVQVGKIPSFRHTKVHTFEYQINRHYSVESYWSSHTQLTSQLPSLKIFKLYVQYCGLTDAKLSGFHSMISSLQGKQLSDFHLNLNNNNLSSLTTNLNFTQLPFKVTTGYYLINLKYNQISNINNVQNLLQSYVYPEFCQNISVELESNQIVDINALSGAFQQFTNLKSLKLNLRSNLIEDLTLLNGIYDQKQHLEYISIKILNNIIKNQSNLNQILLPVIHEQGKSKLKYMEVDLKSPGLGTEYYQNMEIKGQYPSISKDGYCISDYSMAKRFVLGSNICANCINNNCHSCFDNQKCELCRVSTPARELPLCSCPTGYYDGVNYACLPCARQCQSCNNGQTCLTCANSTPKRGGQDCICPDGYYDDGVNDQCQECLPGTKTCKDGMSSLTCTDGYFKKGTQCLQCPVQFSKCEINEETQQIDALQCIGQNRYYVLPTCPCIQGFYEIKNFQNCIQCNPICVECTGAKVCQECIVGYYLDQESQFCKRCNPLCKTCSSTDSCDQCPDRQFDPQTSCQQKYSSGSSSSNNTSNEGSDSSSSTEGDNNNNSGDSNQEGNDSGNTGGNEGTGSDQNGNTGGDQNTGNNNGSTEDNNNGSTGNNNNGSTDGSNNGSTGGNNNGSTNGNGSSNDSNVNEIYLSPEEQVKQSKFQESSKAQFSVVNPVTNLTEQWDCQRQCLSCEESSSKCTSCYIGLNKLDNPPFCSCQEGYHNQNDTMDDCIKCDPLCKTCSQQGTCKTCDDNTNRELNPVNLQCECKKGYKSIKGSKTCEVCFIYLDTCLLQCPQNTVKDLQTQSCLSLNYQIDQQSNTLLFVLCGIFMSMVAIMSILSFKKFISVNQYKILNTNKISQQQKKQGFIDLQSHRKNNFVDCDSNSKSGSEETDSQKNNDYKA